MIIYIYIYTDTPNLVGQALISPCKDLEGVEDDP